jgi:diaminopimelate decarboxylase
MKEILPDTASISPDEHLVIGGCDVVDLARSFGTPLVVMDRATFEARASAFAAAVGAERVFYAGKAFLCVAVCELLDRLGLGLDVCTGGELATARAAGFPGERMLFHGNNKSVDELRMAREAGIGRIVVDSFEEMERIAEVGLQAGLLVRVTPGVEAHTHEFVQTGQEDSKFGFTLADGVARDAVKKALEIPGCRLVGLHAHIGSQIFEMAAFELAARRVAAFAAAARDELGLQVEELNLGGGLGIAHTVDEMTPAPGPSVARIRHAVEEEFAARGMPAPSLFVEPGRAIVGATAVTVYTVGTVKKIPGVRTYVSVDGARYEAFVANRVGAAAGPRVTVSGKHCESGDVLIKDVHLPDDVEPGDLLCMPATGAYTYSMANNYNHVPRPAVVMVHDGAATEIVARETHEDLIRLDRHLDGSSV